MRWIFFRGLTRGIPTGIKNYVVGICLSIKRPITQPITFSSSAPCCSGIRFSPLQTRRTALCRRPFFAAPSRINYNLFLCVCYKELLLIILWLTPLPISGVIINWMIKHNFQGLLSPILSVFGWFEPASRHE